MLKAFPTLFLYLQRIVNILKFVLADGYFICLDGLLNLRNITYFERTLEGVRRDA